MQRLAGAGDEAGAQCDASKFGCLRLLAAFGVGGLLAGRGGSASGALFIRSIGWFQPWLAPLGIGSPALIAMVLQSGWMKSFFRVLRSALRYSYGIYVFHFFISGLLQKPMRTFFTAHSDSKAAQLVLQQESPAW